MDTIQLHEAMEKAEQLCVDVNEGVRDKENSDRLEWIQSHVQCEGITEVTKCTDFCCVSVSYQRT